VKQHYTKNNNSDKSPVAYSVPLSAVCSVGKLVTE